MWVTQNLVSLSGGSPSQGVAVDATDPQWVGTDLLFSYLSVTVADISSPVFVNMGDQPAGVSSLFYDVLGNLVAENTTPILGSAPGTPFTTLANDLIPAGSGNLQMIARSNGQQITGVVFEFNGVSNEPAIGNATAIDF